MEKFKLITVLEKYRRLNIETVNIIFPRDRYLFSVPTHLIENTDDEI